MGDGLNQTLYWLGYATNRSEVITGEVSSETPELDHWTQNSSDREDHRMCGLTLKCTCWDEASLIIDACAVDGIPRCIWRTAWPAHLVLQSMMNGMSENGE